MRNSESRGNLSERRVQSAERRTAGHTRLGNSSTFRQINYSLFTIHSSLFIKLPRRGDHWSSFNYHHPEYIDTVGTRRAVSAEPHGLLNVNNLQLLTDLRSTHLRWALLLSFATKVSKNAFCLSHSERAPNHRPRFVFLFCLFPFCSPWR